MITNNPFSILSETISPIAMQSFVIVMAVLVIAGTLLDIIHKKKLIDCDNGLTKEVLINGSMA